MTDTQPRFSLIIATIGRTAQLLRLLETLKRQTCQSFEIIVVDQNPPGYLDELLAPFQAYFPIRHLTNEPGLSLARNAALDHIRGEFVAFPDDDCWYPVDLLESVSKRMMAHPDWDGITGKLVDPADTEGFQVFHRSSGMVTLDNLWNRSTSVTLFFRRSVVERVGKFDTDLGRGAQSGMTSAEEAEYLIRALLLGFFIYYTPNVVVFHKTWQQSDDLEMSRVFGNRKAFGYILRKYEFPKSFALNKLVRSIGGMCFFALRGNLRRTRYYCRAFLGLANGWLSYSSCEWREPRASLVPRTAQVELRSRAGTDLGR